MLTRETVISRLQYVVDHNMTNHKPFVSPEHAIGCLMCEMDDLMKAINAKPRDGEMFGSSIAHDAIQIAAICVRLAQEHGDD